MKNLFTVRLPNTGHTTRAAVTNNMFYSITADIKTTERFMHLIYSINQSLKSHQLFVCLRRLI